MKKVFFIPAIIASIMLAGSAAGQTKTRTSTSTKTSPEAKPRLRLNRTPDTSLSARYRQRTLLRITDTTGMGTRFPSDSLGKLNFKPSHPSLPAQNNPNPYSPNPSVTNPDRPALKTPAIPPKTKKKKYRVGR